MRAFIACSEADEAVAKELQEFLKPHGLFAEVETGAQGFRHLQKSDVVIALWSRNSVFGTHRMQLEKRMLDAWADEQLVIVKLDHHFLPVGLRDLPSIDGSFESARQTVTWREVSREAKERINSLLVAEQRKREAPTEEFSGFDGMTSGAARGAPLPPSQQVDRGAGGFDLSDYELHRSDYPQMARVRSGFSFAPILFLLFLIGVLVVAYFFGGFEWLAARMDTEAVIGLLSSPTFLAIAGGAIGLLILICIISSLLGGRLKQRRRSEAGRDAFEQAGQSGEEAEAAPAPGVPESENGILFISYAHADNDEVEPLVTVVRTSGREVWIDKGGIQAGTGWAGEIVRAIKSAGGIMIMCSSSAFKSDHVKREIYLADRYRKPMLPVFLEDAQPPEDFEFFFAGVQWLQLFKLPAEDRAGAVQRALAAVS